MVEVAAIIIIMEEVAGPIAVQAVVEVAIQVLQAAALPILAREAMH
jgi:hypothetical protein